MRDALAEGLARSLIDVEAEHGALYAESVGRTILMRLLGAARTRANSAGASVASAASLAAQACAGLCRGQYGESISLPELAGVAGLSRMHFAAQFRAATGYRPHEYLLFRRIEQAKALLSQRADAACRSRVERRLPVAGAFFHGLQAVYGPDPAGMASRRRGGFRCAGRRRESRVHERSTGTSSIPLTNI